VSSESQASAIGPAESEKRKGRSESESDSWRKEILRCLAVQDGISDTFAQRTVSGGLSVPDLASCGCLLLAVCDPICNLQTKREACQLNRHLSDSQVGRRLSLYAVGQNFRPLGNNDLWILQVSTTTRVLPGISTDTRSHVKCLTAVVFDGSLQAQRLPRCWIRVAMNVLTMPVV